MFSYNDIEFSLLNILYNILAYLTDTTCTVGEVRDIKNEKKSSQPLSHSHSPEDQNHIALRVVKRDCFIACIVHSGGDSQFTVMNTI